MSWVAYNSQLQEPVTATNHWIIVPHPWQLITTTTNSFLPTTALWTILETGIIDGEPQDYQDVVGAFSEVESSGHSARSSSSSSTVFSYSDQPYGFQQLSENQQGYFRDTQPGAQTFDQQGFRFTSPWNGTSYGGQTYNNQTSISHCSGYSSSLESPSPGQYSSNPRPGAIYLEKRYSRSSSDSSSTATEQSAITAPTRKRGPGGPKLPEMKDLELELEKESARNGQLKADLRTRTKEKDLLFSKVVNFF